MPILQLESPFLVDHDADVDEVERWRAVEAQLRARAVPLAHLVGHKSVAWATGRSGGQVSKELNGTDEKSLSALVLLYLADKTRDHDLAVLASKAMGRRVGELISPPDLREENEKLRAEVTRLRALLRAGLSEAAP